MVVRVASLLLLVMFAGIADAQQLQAPPAVPGAIVGVVTDTFDLAVGDALISIPALQRSTRTAHDGTFRFNDVSPGAYDLTTQRIGFYPRQETVQVGAGGGSIKFVLVPSPQTLAPIVTVSSRIGVSGVVGDTAFRPLPHVQVSLNAGRSTQTDSLGRFFIATKPGQYVLRIREPGYATALVSVRVPRDSGRHVVVMLKATQGNTWAREAFIMEALRGRLLRRTSFSSRIFTREDLTRIGFRDLEQIARAGAVGPVSGICTATVDGLWEVPLTSIVAAELEFVEVYAGGQSTDPFNWRPRRSTGNFRTGPLPSTRVSMGCPTVYAWLRSR